MEQITAQEAAAPADVKVVNGHYLTWRLGHWRCLDCERDFAPQGGNVERAAWDNPCTVPHGLFSEGT